MNGTRRREITLMILEEIRLTDFRCFFGETSIQFSEDPEKNVTIIYAENGVGKTTLLNALLWCFYVSGVSANGTDLRL
ncbi:hypothetical protein GCM10007897_41860 [Sphingobium jiangsuense]|nr:hypothetical protein GCM10007897_41860 [Sphingobium jiangsuense]